MELQWISEIIGITTKNDVVPVATSNAKLFLKTIWWKIISLYIYKDLRLRILGLMSHVTIIMMQSPRCGFGFEAAFQL